MQQIGMTEDKLCCSSTFREAITPNDRDSVKILPWLCSSLSFLSGARITGFNGSEKSSARKTRISAFLRGASRFISANCTLLLFLFQKSQYYAKIAAELQIAIDNVLWNEEAGMWFDYDMKNNQPRNTFYPSNLTPLYTKSYNRHLRVLYAMSAVKYLQSQNIDSFFGEFA